MIGILELNNMWWKDVILIICLSFSWIPMYGLYKYVIVPVFDFFNCGKIEPKENRK